MYIVQKNFAIVIGIVLGEISLRSGNKFAGTETVKQQKKTHRKRGGERENE